MVAAPPADDDAGTPFQPKTHTSLAILCGDFNLEASQPEHALIEAAGLRDAWRALYGARPQDPTYSLFDHSYWPYPIACDFVFASAGLVPHLQRMWVTARRGIPITSRWRCSWVEASAPAHLQPQQVQPAGHHDGRAADHQQARHLAEDQPAPQRHVDDLLVQEGRRASPPRRSGAPAPP